MENDTLAHTGVIGMHWGHKKASGWSPKDNTAAKQQVAKSGKKIAKPFVKPEKKTSTTSTGPRLTDAQLKSRINRIEMEQKYATLTKKKISPGRKMVTDILTNAFKTTATTYLTKMMGKNVEKLMNGKAPDAPVPP